MSAAPRGLSGVNLHFVQTMADAEEFMRWLGERHENNAIAFDTETSGLNPYAHDARVRLIQFGDTMTGWALPYADWRGVAVEALRKFDGQLIAHNIAFDMRWIEEHSNYTFSAANTHDTMIAAHIINPLGSGALKPLANQYVDPRASAGEHRLKDGMKENHWDWDTVPVDYPPYYLYGALDTVITARLYEKFLPYVGVGGHYREVYDLEMATRHIVSRMEARGARVDVAYAAQQKEKLERFVEETKDWAQDLIGVSLTSTAQLGKWFRDQGMPINSFTPTGLPKMDKYQLQLYALSDVPLVRMIASGALEMRKAGKIAASYFSNFLEYEVDGIIHPSIKTLGARTGRMSVGNPALQQLPKGDSLVRRAFLAREGNSLLSADFNQIEMRIMACFAKDATLQQAFHDADATGGDFFVTVGKQVYQDPDFKKSDPRRNLIKGVMYGSAYGAGVAKMAETAGVPFDQMKEASDSLSMAYPGMKRFMQEIEATGQRREREEGQGYVMTPLGRRLPCDEGRTYTLTNYIIQSTAADIFKKALVNLDCAGYGEFMLLPVHDEILLDMPTEDIEQAKQEVPALMQDDSFAVTMSTDAEGPYQTWGDKY